MILPCRIFLIALIAGITSAFSAIGAESPQESRAKAGAWDSLKLEWQKPEGDDNYWGTPIGNGFIGAKIKGGIGTEILQLNDKTFWSGAPGDTYEPKRLSALAETRKKLAAGDIPGANDAARGMWGPQEVGTYLPIGKLSLKFDHGDTATSYQRVLDLNRAVSTVSYAIGPVNYTREAFASFPDRVIVMRLSSNAPGKITFAASLAIPKEMEGHGQVSTEGRDMIVMRGKAPANDRKTWDDKIGMTYETRLRILPKGGRMTTQDNGLRVEGADSVVLILADATSYNGGLKDPVKEGVAPSPLVKTAISSASAKTYDQLLAAHLADYQSLFHRLWVELNGEKPNRFALGFQFARYEMISVSRTGDRPHNQQGMWNYAWFPMSNCSHFLNENVEKYYSLIEPANLADTGEPLWNWIAELAATGAKTARADWGFHGWLAPHYSDVWASTTLKGGNNEWTIWPMGGIWLCQLLWEHYAFGMDREFLRARAYPIMRGACEFALDLLVDDGKGHLVSSPSTSPENQFRLVEGGPTFAVSQGSTMDLALIGQLFENTIAAGKILGVDSDFQSKLRAARAKLLPFQIGKNGELQEWSQDFPKRDDGHRHASHIVSVWPLAQITERGTPALFQAAKVALENRGGGGYHPDKGAMWARLKEGEKSIAAKDSYYTGGSLAGQFPPKYAGFCEMLVQSHAGEIELLPALPPEWKSGKIDGIRARGGYELALEWENGEITKCAITGPAGPLPPIRYKGALVDPARDHRFTLHTPALSRG